ncbi:MAG: hypothetical protein UV28_C0008G0017 [Candidatus Collierbacteria bacterium GW2011_GWE2_42_48]|nr:MAG: hypothetical protein UV28_C0008G0017 [Candidatus Collierbacteria bacterium GW2011_GWE2_42_48]
MMYTFVVANLIGTSFLMTVSDNGNLFLVGYTEAVIYFI